MQARQRGAQRVQQQRQVPRARPGGARGRGRGSLEAATFLVRESEPRRWARRPVPER